MTFHYRVATLIQNKNSSTFQEIPGDFGNFFKKKLQQNILKR